MSDRAWTLLLMGEENGIAGGPGRTFEKHPAHYERVTVIERDPALARIKELENQYEASRLVASAMRKKLEAENQRLRDILYDDIGVFRKVKASGRPITATQVSDVLDAVQALLGGGE